MVTLILLQILTYILRRPSKEISLRKERVQVQTARPSINSTDWFMLKMAKFMTQLMVMKLTWLTASYSFLREEMRMVLPCTQMESFTTTSTGKMLFMMTSQASKISVSSLDTISRRAMPLLNGSETPSYIALLHPQTVFSITKNIELILTLYVCI